MAITGQTYPFKSGSLEKTKKKVFQSCRSPLFGTVIFIPGEFCSPGKSAEFHGSVKL